MLVHMDVAVHAPPCDVCQAPMNSACSSRFILLHQQAGTKEDISSATLLPKEVGAGSATQKAQAKPGSRQPAPDVNSTTDSPGGLLMDPSPLLQQLQLFQDQLQQFATSSPQQTGTGRHIPHQSSPMSKHTASATPKAAIGMYSQGAQEVDVRLHEQTPSSHHTDPLDAAETLALSSHDAFRQAMMQRLQAQSQHLTQALSGMGSPSALSPAQSSLYTSQEPDLAHAHSQTQRKSSFADAEKLELGSMAMQHGLSESLAESAASVSSPASRALESILSILHALPAGSTAIHPVTAMTAEIPEADVKGKATGQSAPLGIGRESTPHTGSASARAAKERPASGAPERFAQDTDPALCEGRGRRASEPLPAVERELARLLGPKFGPARRATVDDETVAGRASQSSRSSLGRPGSGR